MYTPIVLTGTYRVVRSGEQYEDIEAAKEAARKLLIEQGQIPAVMDECRVVQWKGGTIKAKPETKRLSIPGEKC
ncbi:MAG TPA: hypothetical protein VJ302_28370 [Blastocatellia bacterium]|nr:hypothetical protein [Blastocatellia bacterium]